MPPRVAPPMPLVGRSAEFATLSAALDAASNGRGSVHFLIGEGGIGKTRLATAVADAATAKGFARVAGRSYPVETGIPYALFADGYLPLLRAMPSSMLQVLARGSVAELATLFPPLRAEGISTAALDEYELKPRLLDAFSRFVQRLAQREPQFVLLENLHWSDPSSLELLHVIARGAAAHKLVLICTYDDTRRDGNPTLRATERSLRSLDAIVVHQLPHLTPLETRELVRRQFNVNAEVIEGFATLLHARTQGNPFFIEETLASLINDGRLREENGRWAGWEVNELAMPGTVRDAIGSRLERLTEGARQVATIAAATGGTVPHALLERLSGLGGEALLSAVDELRGDRILVETEAQRGLGYEFAHPLLREVLYTSLSRARARALHGQIADALEAELGAEALAHAGQLAAHFVRADSPAAAPRALRYLVVAGRSALERGASHEAAETLGAALRIAEGTGETGAQVRLGAEELEGLLDLAARARQRLGDLSGAAGLWQRAVALAEARGDHARAASHERRLGVTAFWQGGYDDALSHYDRGLAAVAHDAPRTAQLLLARSAVHLELGSATEALADIHRAREIAEGVGDAALRSRAHHALQLAAIWRGPASEAREHGARALALAREAGDLAAQWSAEWALAVHAGLTGHSAELVEHVGAANALADALQSPVLRLRADEVLLEYRAGAGEWDSALALADRAIADARAFSQHTLLPRVLVWSSLIHFARGDVARGTPQMEEAWSLARADRAKDGAHVNVHAAVPVHVSRAAMHVARREFREALEVAEAGIALADRTGYLVWAVHRLVPIAGEAALELRDFDRARAHGTRLKADSERLGHPLGLAWADACFGLIRWLQGDPQGAIPELEAAATALEAIPFVYHGARVRHVLADAYIATGDHANAAKQLRLAHDTLARLGAVPAQDAARNRLRDIGARPPTRTVAEGVGSLTPREVEIAILVAARKSNKEIGSALEISARTVGTHLSNIFTKLNVDSRGALTDLVREGKLESPPGAG